MKYEEVMEQKKGFKVERVNIKDGTMTITVSSDWLETVSDAVEKQIPKKPKYNGGECECPTCGDGWNSNEYGSGMKFCWECGQKLDWSDDND